MGLSASQARLLTITARKSDCEFQSMRYSHDKLALSRNMTDISSEYQNALNQTKLVYDYYGKGDTTTPLSYNLLMTPSQLNGYMPTLVTDASGKAVLNSQYAAAARAAGIPQEGLGSLPSSDVRNRFLQGLADNGLITQEMSKTCQGIQYSQAMGMGSTDMVTVSTKNLDAKELAELIDLNGFTLNLSSTGFSTAVNNNKQNIVSPITMTDLLTNDYTIYGTTFDDRGAFARFGDCGVVGMSQLSCWEDIINAFNSALDNGTDISKKALAEATRKTRDLVYFNDVEYTDHDGGKLMSSPGKENPSTSWGYYESRWKWTSARDGRDTAAKFAYQNSSKYIGYYGFDSRNSNGWLNAGQHDSVGISISNIAKAFLTYYVAAMEGLYSDYKINSDNGFTAGGGRDGSGNYRKQSGEARTVADSNLIDIYSDYEFTIINSIDVNSDQALYSGFYDALFNQLCTRGWVENNNITDNGYMQEMLQNGMMFLANIGDDGFYYQGNYATNTFIKEITDEEAIAKAEAKYNTEKQKINNKEQIIDLKMKNLDTEISSLTTEYDTVKSVISKNIEKSFKRYDA